MKRLYPLRKEARFDAVSELMEGAGRVLTRLEACSFPSRPEARLATWSNADGQPVARYRYEPDIELRWLAIDRHQDRAELAAELEESGLFDAWEALEAALESGVWKEVFRAAAAFRVAAEVREEGVDGLDVLTTALSSDERWTRRAAATQLAEVADGSCAVSVTQALEQCEDIETRLALRRAMDRIEMEEFSSR